jgi:hypothetical protein
MSTQSSARRDLVSTEASTPKAIVAGLALASIPVASHVRAAGLTPVRDQNLPSRPSSHWGINE